MKILYLGNNWVGWQILQWLKEQGEEIVGLVIHPSGKQKFGEEIKEVAQMKPTHIFDGSKLRQSETLEAIQSLNADIALSVLFGYILKPDFINSFPKGVVNLHPSYLPYNQGSHPNIWSIVEQTPAGVTLHYIDDNIDTGDIIAQQQLPIDPIDTGASLYRKLEQVCVALFKKNWPQIRADHAPRLPQMDQKGTYHRTRDVGAIDLVDLDQTYKARELINIIRARTFSPYPGAYFMHQERKVYLRLQLFYEEQLNEEGE